MTKEWMNDAGWWLRLHINTGYGAYVELIAPGESRPVLYRNYQYWEAHRAESEAEGVARLGAMQEVACVRA